MVIDENIGMSLSQKSEVARARGFGVPSKGHQMWRC